MARERRGLRPKWVRHTLVMAELIEKGVPIKHRLLETRLTRDEALAYERAAIARYLKRGVVLANYQHNRAFKGTVADVAGDLMRKMGMARGHDRRAAV